MLICITRILEIAKERGISNQELCRVLNGDRNKIDNWKNGKSKPTVEELANLIRYFNISSDYLLGLVDEKKEIIIMNNDKVIIFSSDLAEFFSYIESEPEREMIDADFEKLLTHIRVHITDKLHIELDESIEIKLQPKNSRESEIFAIFVQRMFERKYLTPTSDPYELHHNPGKSYNENFSISFRFKNIHGNQINGNVTGGNFIQSVNKGTVSFNGLSETSKEEADLVRIFDMLDGKRRNKLLNLAYTLEDEFKEV